ncbi:MAG: DUF6323 family protein [Clostridium sp.]|nr:DUF6323 family protein [Clostridium sp.]
MEEKIFELIQAKKQEVELKKLIACNERTGRFGLSLTEEAAQELMVCRNESLKKYRRVEFGEGILDKLIDAFCDSQYIHQEDYVETLEKLQDIFYEYKNESRDRLTDDELLTFMREQFEKICFGDLDYLEGTCLRNFAQALRHGYKGYRTNGGRDEYGQFDEVTRWDSELYFDAAKELFWG